MPRIAGKITFNAYDDDWLHMARLKEELQGLEEGDPRRAEIEALFDTMENSPLVEIDLNAQ